MIRKNIFESIFFLSKVNKDNSVVFYQYEKVPNCMYWDNSVGTIFETSVW